MQEGYICGGVGNRFPKRDVDQNVILDTKVQDVRINILTSKHCTNVPHMEKLVMSEVSGVVFYYACMLPTQRLSGKVPIPPF